MDINKEFEKFIKEDKLEEAFWKVDIPDMPPIFVEAGSAAEIKASMRKKLKTSVVKELVIDRVSKAEMVKKYRELAKGKGDGDDEEETSEAVEEAVNLKQLKIQYDKNEDQNRHTENYLLLAKTFGTPAEVKKVQYIMKRNVKQGHTSKSDNDWMYKNINPYYDKIRNEEYMKLEDTVKNVLEGELPPALQKAIDKKKGKKDDSEVKEDDDPDTPGTQGDKAEYQKKRKAVAKKFGVGDCSQLSGAKKKACYTALDKAHVADHEEQVELKNMRKEDTQKSFSKVFSNLKNTMKEKKKKMLKGYSSNY